MSDALTIADVLERAADLIEPEGAWTQGRFGSRAAGCYCAYGAMIEAYRDFGEPNSGLYSNLYTSATRCLEDAIGGRVAAFNDAPDRTQAEVVAKLREAAALAREQGQ